MSCSMPRHNGGKRPLILTSPILVEYTTKMHGMDVANQLHGNYSLFSKSHG